MSNESIFFNILGLIGALLLLFGFYRITTGKWNNGSFWYELDNLIGALLLLVYQVKYHAYVTAVLNLVWGTIALIGLITFFKRLHTHKKFPKNK